MLAKFLASRFAGPVIVALLAIAAAGAIYGYIQGGRADRATKLADTRQTTIETLQARVISDRGLIAQRDSLIATQNAGIAALAAQRGEDRIVYLQNYAKADERAKDNDARSAQLLADQRTFTDELAQCRASRLLLEEDLTQ